MALSGDLSSTRKHRKTNLIGLTVYYFRFCQCICSKASVTYTHLHVDFHVPFGIQRFPIAINDFPMLACVLRKMLWNWSRSLRLPFQPASVKKWWTLAVSRSALVACSPSMEAYVCHITTKDLYHSRSNCSFYSLRSINFHLFWRSIAIAIPSKNCLSAWVKWVIHIHKWPVSAASLYQYINDSHATNIFVNPVILDDSAALWRWNCCSSWWG